MSEDSKGRRGSLRLPAWRRKKEPPQVELTDLENKDKYDVMAALAKALLVFMVSYGAVGGFLNAYGMEFNRFLCVAGILGLSLLLSFIYETEKKWFTNLCVIGVFIAYAYVAVRRFWILNSGAYAVINKMYDEAQAYLGVVGGGLYNLQVEDAYRTTTAIALFVGAVLVILLVIRLQYKASLVRTVLLTFTLYLVPIYFEKTPDLICLFLLLSGYCTLGIMQCSRIKKHLSRQIKQTMPVGMALAAAVVVALGIFLPKIRYRILVPKNPSKAATEQSAVTYARYGIMALFMNNVAGGGVNNGRLSQNVMVMPDNETDLIVRFTPYSMGPTYLKAFTGLDYDGQRWSRAADVLGANEGLLMTETKGREALYRQDPEVQARGIMEVMNAEIDDWHEYVPYYADGNAGERLGREELAENGKSGMRYVYYPMVSDAAVPGADVEEVSRRYLTVPALCRDAVENACRAAGLSGTPEEIASGIIDYFDREYSYTLRPGYYFGTMDYISYFLSRNKKGYCTHFASAGTMLFRSMGIPARYVEGYVFTYTDVVTDGTLVDGAAYEDYYDGYSPLGDTALVEVEVPDANAHAWVEIYLEDRGWVVVDVTPAALEEEDEETGSFWDAILGSGSQQGSQADQTQQEMTQYIENALAGGMGAFGVGLFLAAVYFLGKWLLIRYRESKLSGRERVQLEYGRLTGYLKERDEDFLKLTTPKEELEYMAEHYGTVMPEGLREELYETFFAPETGRDYDALRRKLLEIQKSVRSFSRGTRGSKRKGT